MHSQIYDCQSGEENFDIKFPAGEALQLVLENPPTQGEVILTIGTDALSPSLIEIAGNGEIDVDAETLEAVPEGRLCRFNLWHRDGSSIELMAEGRFVRRVSIAPSLPTAPFTASATGPLLLFDGDSVMHNMPGTRIFLEQMLGHKFRFPEGYQNATGGDSAQKIYFGAPEVTARIERDNTVALVGPIGANQTPADDSFVEITGFMEQIFDKYLAAGAIVVAVPTLLDGMGITTQDAKKTALAEWVVAYASGGTVTYEGTDYVLTPHEGFYAVDVSAFDRNTMKSDVSHPNLLGAEYLAGQLAEVLSPLVSGSVHDAEASNNILDGAVVFQGSRAAAAPGTEGAVPVDWGVTRAEGSAIWTGSYDAEGRFQISVADAPDDGTCILTFSAAEVNAVEGDIVSFAADVAINEGATGLRSVGLLAQGQSPMTLDPDWGASAGIYHLRTADLPYAAAQVTQTMQIYLRVAAGASLTVTFHRASAFFVENTVNDLRISGTPDSTATVGEAYSFSPTISGGQALFDFDLAGGVLPAGVSLNATTGELTGTPSQEGVTQGIAIRVTDAHGETAVLPYFEIDVVGTGVPINQSLPTISSTSPTVGDILTANPGSWSPVSTTYHYQWRAAGAGISGATNAIYSVQAQDIGTALSVEVIGENEVGSGAAAVSADTAPVQAAASGAVWDATINTSAPEQLSYSVGDTVVSATSSINGLRHTRGVNALTGKRYFECVLGPQVLGVGVATGNVTALLGGSFGVDRAFWSGGFLFHTGGNTNMGGALAEGDVIQIAVDVDAQSIWMRRNGSGDWNNDASADPVGGVGGRDISGLTGAIYAHAGLQNDATASVTLAGALGDFSYAPPSGFSAIG